MGSVGGKMEWKGKEKGLNGYSAGGKDVMERKRERIEWVV